MAEAILDIKHWGNNLGVRRFAEVLGLKAKTDVIDALLIARFIAPLIEDWSGLAQLPVYVVLGLVWLLPLRRFLIWRLGDSRALMNTGVKPAARATP